MAGARRMLTVRISEESRSAIEAYCATQGVSITAWVEAVGRRIQELQAGDTADATLQTVAAETIQIARDVDRKRRSRQRPTGQEG